MAKRDPTQPADGRPRPEESSVPDTSDGRHRAEAVRQSRTRAVNEEIGHEPPQDPPVPGPRWYECECGDPGCKVEVSLSEAQYESARGSSTRFVICRNHENPETQSVVGEDPSHATIDVVGRETRRIARARDPRTPPGR